MNGSPIRRIVSVVTYVNIEILRVVDFFRRIATGVPVAKESKITPDLFVGGQYSRKGFKKLVKWGVTLVVSMRKSTPASYVEMAGVDVLHLQTKDNTAPTFENLKKGSEYIKGVIEDGGKVYVHCRQGVGRGPTLAAAYLISEGLSLDDALRKIKNSRVISRPNKRQRKALEEFERKIIS